jgi:hypothetical protein
VFVKKKRMAAFVVLILGIALFVFALYEKGRVNSAKGNISSGTGMFSGNAVGNMVGEVLQGEASKYDTTLNLMEIGGIILILVGGGMLFYLRKSK